MLLSSSRTVNHSQYPCTGDGLLRVQPEPLRPGVKQRSGVVLPLFEKLGIEQALINDKVPFEVQELMQVEPFAGLLFQSEGGIRGRRLLEAVRRYEIIAERP